MLEIVVPLVLFGLIVLLMVMLATMVARATRGAADRVDRWRAPKTGPERAIGRPTYRSSGKVRWTRFLPCAAATLGVGALGAVGLHAAYFMESYYMILTPLFASVPMMATVFWAVAAGHCRNHRIAWLLGLTAAVVLYSGYYYVGWVHAVGVNNAHRIEELPDYIVWRMQTTVWVDRDQQPDADGDDEPPVPALNAMLAAIELGSLLALVPFAAGVRSRRVYDEATGRWSDLLLAPLASGSGSPLRNALIEGRLPQAIAQMPHGRLTSSQPYCEVAVEHTPPDALRPSPSPVYLSLRELRLPGALGILNYYLPLGIFSGGRELVRQCELSPEEVAALHRIFPALADRSGTGA